MFALRSCSSTLISRRPILCLALSTNSTNAAPGNKPPAAFNMNMFEFLETTSERPSIKPQAFPEAGEDPAPEGRGFPKNPYRPAAFQGSHQLPRSHLIYRLHCRASRNNTMVHVTEPDGRCIGWFSGGSLKFKGVNRASYEAGYQCAVAAFQVIKNVVKAKGPVQVELFFRGFGQGREAMKTALLAVEGTEIRRLVSQLQDRSPIKIGGTRAPKARRL